MSEFQLIIEMEGSDDLIEIQYDPTSNTVFNTWYDETGMPIKREVKKMRRNPIPLIKDELEQKIRYFNQTIE